MSQDYWNGTYTVHSQVVFDSEARYEAFKAELKSYVVDHDLQVNDFDVIASEPPIIVSYSLQIPLKLPPPPFESIQDDRDRTQATTIFILVMLSAMAGALFVAVPAAFFTRAGKGS